MHTSSKLICYIPPPHHTHTISHRNWIWMYVLVNIFSVGNLLRVYFCNLFVIADDLRHWVCTTSVNTNKDSDVYVMDSLGGVFPISPSLQQQIAQVYGGKRSQLIIRRLSVQQQVGAKDCGLFAVAFAVEVCQRNDPSRVSYDQNKMRSHFVSCLEKGHLDTFPQGRKSQENTPRPKGQSTSIPVLSKPACRSRSSSKR